MPVKTVMQVAFVVLCLSVSVVVFVGPMMGNPYAARLPDALQAVAALVVAVAALFAFHAFKKETRYRHYVDAAMEAKFHAREMARLVSRVRTVAYTLSDRQVTVSPDHPTMRQMRAETFVTIKQHGDALVVALGKIDLWHKNFCEQQATQLHDSCARLQIASHIVDFPTPEYEQLIETERAIAFGTDDDDFGKGVEAAAEWIQAECRRIVR